MTTTARGSRDAIRAAYRISDKQALAPLLADAAFDAADRAEIAAAARGLIEEVRSQPQPIGGVETFLAEYSLSTREGIVLMCLAEALLRIPDAQTADRLIKDKIGGADWERHIGHSSSLFVNASTWALMLTGRLFGASSGESEDFGDTLARLAARGGEPMIRQALVQAMKLMGRQFVMGRTIEEALERGARQENRVFRYSFDMLGEAARTRVDAERFLLEYEHAVDALKTAAKGLALHDAPAISIKLSALHPRFDFSQADRTRGELVDCVAALAARARDAGIGLTVDAEEADRLELTLDVFEGVLHQDVTDGWDGFGLAVQGYQKRAPHVIDWIATTSRAARRRVTVRLVKGAYWDTEIKRSQEGGYDHYPVYARKQFTDASYHACARRLLAAGDAMHPQFATHNANTIAALLAMRGRQPIELQRLHGMGEALYRALLAKTYDVRVRVYAPVGDHKELLPYLVRRLLENGANTSFVHRIVDPDLPPERLVTDAATLAAQRLDAAEKFIPRPPHIFGDRKNARGVDLSDPLACDPVTRAVRNYDGSADAAPIIDGRKGAGGKAASLFDPADRRRVIGSVVEATTQDVNDAFESAARAQPAWNATSADSRAAALERLADSLETDIEELVALAVREAGKTLPDAISEVREAIDFCRYYAAEARRLFGKPIELPGPTGEANHLFLDGRGVFACISPWNFPLAIFLGQITAALAAGNAVLAKPAEQTPLIAAAAVRRAHAAGMPSDLLHLLPGDGEKLGSVLLTNEHLAGVAFTGGVETAHAINRALAAREGPILPLIAETGGQNAMLVDSSALPEQVATDVLASAFQSAGQRCSALRVLCLQDDIADRVIEMLQGAMAELRIGDPGDLATDIGPIIDEEACERLANHVARMEAEAKVLFRCSVGPETQNGTYFAPHLIEIDSLDRLTGEVFGPILHVMRFDANEVEATVRRINALGFGLTMGIQSRIDSTADRIFTTARVGNTYVNRNMIGAVVGVQPFGGQGLSGTGPKAGGPHYLLRFAHERTRTINTAAIGGNAALLDLTED